MRDLTRRTLTNSWARLQVAGKAPPGRSYHSATALEDGQTLVLFGGNDDKQSFNKVHVLKMTQDRQWEWFHPEVRTQNRNACTDQLTLHGSCDGGASRWWARRRVRGLAIPPCSSRTGKLSFSTAVQGP